MVDYRRKNSSAFTDINKANVVDSGMRADGEFEYQELYMALDSLSVKERSAILLYYMQGYTIREVAQITGDGEDAVKMQLSRGRTHLKNKLSNGR
jgi:RNA polymerase sigma-70 factor (ECF subfamily)